MQGISGTGTKDVPVRMVTPPEVDAGWAEFLLVWTESAFTFAWLEFPSLEMELSFKGFPPLAGACWSAGGVTLALSFLKALLTGSSFLISGVIFTPTSWFCKKINVTQKGKWQGRVWTNLNCTMSHRHGLRAVSCFGSFKKGRWHKVLPGQVGTDGKTNDGEQGSKRHHHDHHREGERLPLLLRRMWLQWLVGSHLWQRFKVMEK